MRYILKEIVIADLCDEEINDEEVSKSIFDNLVKDQIDFSAIVSVKDGESALLYERMRATSVNGNLVNIKIYKNNSVMIYKDVPIKNFIEIKIITKNSDKYIKPNNDNRIRFLDTE